MRIPGHNAPFERCGGLAMSYGYGARGQALVEYALLLVLVAIAAIVVLILIGPQIGNVFSQITYVLNPTSGLGGYP